jgi:hypothetical protein
LDFVILNKRADEHFGAEVKYQADVSGRDEQSISKGIGGGLLLTMHTFTLAKPHPLWGFLLLRCEAI